MEPEMVSLIAELGTGAAIIGVITALLIRLDNKIDRVHDKLDTKIDFVALDVVDLKVSVARIEGHLEASDGFTATRPVRSDPETDAEQASPEYRQVG